MKPKPETALLILGHGSTENPDSSDPTLLHARAIREQGLFAEVLTAFWKEEPAYRDVPYSVNASEVYVVPNFISEGYFTQTIIPRELGLEGAVTVRDGQTWKYCEPVGNHPDMTALLRQGAEQVAPGVDPRETALMVVGHGTGLNENSALAAKRQAELLASQTEYAQVLNTYMEEEPLISKWAELADTPNVVVVPFFISDGLHSYQDIPVLLGIEAEPTAAASQREVFRQNPYRMRGKTLYYASAIGTAPGFAQVFLDQVEAFDARHVEVAA